ncbi:MAG TPA: alpha-glucuronidase family glycosyl hydrolase, partial [Pyrinomonadaceae bacterium]|nr:alpha-glucuronidase family glycosyl hydrolase [Pyrinomonadaceae bacterium]
MRYEKLPSADTYRQSIRSIAVQGKSATFDVIRRELSFGCAGLLGSPLVVGDRDEASVVVGLPQTSSLIGKLRWEAELKSLGPEGYRIRTVRDGNRNVIAIASSTDIGALYGTFHFLRLLQTEQPLGRLQLDQSPRLNFRILNHWDNLDGSIERGYAGKS